MGGSFKSNHDPLARQIDNGLHSCMQRHGQAGIIIDHRNSSTQQCGTSLESSTGR
jgi:hypothetical protein